MKVYAIHEVERNSVRIHVESGVDEHGRHLYIGSDNTLHAIVSGQEPPLYMRLDAEIAEAVAEALSPPHPVATERHLDDALYMRDRLMDMVERLALPNMRL